MAPCVMAASAMLREKIHVGTKNAWVSGGEAKAGDGGSRVASDASRRLDA